MHRLSALVMLTLLFTGSIAYGQSAKKSSKAKKQFTNDHHALSPCDPFYMPWGTSFEDLLKKIKKDGGKNIQIDSIESNGKTFIAIGFEDQQNRYVFTCREGFGFAIASVYEYYKKALDAQNIFDSECMKASVNYREPTINNTLRKGFRHECSKYISTLVLTLANDKEIVYVYGHLPKE